MKGRSGADGRRVQVGVAAGGASDEERERLWPTRDRLCSTTDLM